MQLLKATHAAAKNRKQFCKNFRDALRDGRVADLRRFVAEAGGQLPVIDSLSPYVMAHEALSNGHLHVLKYLTEQFGSQLSPETESVLIVTPLHCACANGFLSSIKYYLDLTLPKSGASPRRQCIESTMALQDACHCAGLAVVQYLFSKVEQLWSARDGFGEARKTAELPTQIAFVTACSQTSIQKYRPEVLSFIAAEVDARGVQSQQLTTAQLISADVEERRDTFAFLTDAERRRIAIELFGLPATVENYSEIELFITLTSEPLPFRNAKLLQLLTSLPSDTFSAEQRQQLLLNPACRKAADAGVAGDAAQLLALLQQSTRGRKLQKL